MYCPFCGTLNKKGAERCNNCKQPLPRLDQPPEPWPPPAPEAPPAGEEKLPGEALPLPRPDFYPGLPGSQYNYIPSQNLEPSPYSPGLPYNRAAYNNFSAAQGYSYPIDRIGVAQHDAGFWIRLGAFLIDSIIGSLITVVILGIPQLVYWSNFIGKYGNELARNCPNSFERGNYARGPSQICSDTLESIFISRNELGSILTITIGFGLVTVILLLAYSVGMTAYGATVGKRVFGLKVVKEDGAPPGFLRALLRMTLGYWISSAIFYLGFIWIAFDEHKQAWHDKIAGTYVVRI